jgi:hypothetical protein
MTTNFQPSEYTPDKKYQSAPITTNPRSFSVSWTNTPNIQGIKPPSPQFQPAPNVSYILPQTVLPSSSEHGEFPVGIIQSKREPYGVEYVFNGYGGLESKLGTNLGR